MYGANHAIAKRITEGPVNVKTVARFRVVSPWLVYAGIIRG